MEIDFAKIARQVVEFALPYAEGLVPLDWRPAISPAFAALRVLIPIVFEGIASGESSDELIGRLRGSVRSPIELNKKVDGHLARVRQVVASDPQIMATARLIEGKLADATFSDSDRQILRNFVSYVRFENP